MSYCNRPERPEENREDISHAERWCPDSETGTLSGAGAEASADSDTALTETVRYRLEIPGLW